MGQVYFAYDSLFRRFAQLQLQMSQTLQARHALRDTSMFFGNFPASINTVTLCSTCESRLTSDFAKFSRHFNMLLRQRATLRLQQSRSTLFEASFHYRNSCHQQNPCCSSWFQKQSVTMAMSTVNVGRRQAFKPAHTSQLNAYASSRGDLNPVEVVKREAALASNRWDCTVTHVYIHVCVHACMWHATLHSNRLQYTERVECEIP